MEKDQLLSSEDREEGQPQTTQTSSRGRRIIILAFLLYALWVLHPSEGTWFPLRTDSPPLESQNRSKPFRWDDLPTKPYLDYEDCYGDFKCARLELPMDYWNSTTDATISLAIVKKPAKVPVTHPQYGGVTLYNPGGPGGSGIGLLLAAADRLGEVINTDDGEGKYFDQLSFDPRGIGLSTPRVYCTHNYGRDIVWALRMNEQGLLTASDAALGRLWSMEAARGQSCSLPVDEGEVDVKKYVSTASVSRDMIEIIEKHGEWREKEAKRLLQEDARDAPCTVRTQDPAMTETWDRVKHKHGEEKINYWGFSYGSYLGNTFAAMYPDRINRLIVDGVVDAYDYKKALWLDNLVDAERDLGLFYYHCTRVGFPRCALANATGTTTEEGVRQRLKSIVNSLYHNPLPVVSKSGPEVVTYSSVKGLILGVLYAPLGGFDILAKLLLSIENGDGQFFADLFLRPISDFICPPCKDGKRNPSFDGEGPDVLGDGQMAIACSDGDDQTWMTKPDFADHLKNLTDISPTIGEVWAITRLMCTHYSVKSLTRFEGPWVGNTSHPILEIGNSADPVTPGRYAKKMAKGFKGAVALIQDSGGHCSISSPSKCTENYVRQYFQTGELPPEDTVCKPDELPFGGKDGETVLDEEAQQVKERQLEIAAALFASGGGFMSRDLGGKMVGHGPYLFTKND